MLGRLAVTFPCSLVHAQRQAGHRLGDHADAGVYRGELDSRGGVYRFPGAAGAEVEGRRGAHGIPGLVPGAEQRGEWVFHIQQILS